MVFDGYYGMRNTGDDAFCVVAADVARSRWNAHTLSFLAPQSVLPPLPGPVRGIFPEPPRFRGHGRLGPLPAMLRARNVVHVGGSTFMKPLTRHRDQTRLARVGLLNLHAVGVSIGPFKDAANARVVERSLRLFRTVSVRDAASAQRLADMGSSIKVTRAFDVAVLLGRSPYAVGLESSNRSRPILGVSLCAHEAKRGGDAGQEERRFVRTAALVGEVVRKTQASVRVLVFNDHPHWGDAALSERFVDLVAGDVEVVPRSPDPAVMLAEVAACDAVLATRLHTAVFAFASGVPFGIVAYQQKGRDFAAEVRLPDELVFPADGPDPSDGSRTIVGLVEGAVPDDLLPVEEARARANSAFPETL